MPLWAASQYRRILENSPIAVVMTVLILMNVGGL